MSKAFFTKVAKLVLDLNIRLFFQPKKIKAIFTQDFTILKGTAFLFYIRKK